jgi:hypothetical protein
VDRHWPHRLPIALALLAALVGATFALQGVGVPIGRSFMIGDLRWTAIGVALMVVAGAVAWRSGRRS